jgi:hypothetical protein
MALQVFYKKFGICTIKGKLQPGVIILIASKKNHTKFFSCIDAGPFWIQRDSKIVTP